MDTSILEDLGLTGAEIKVFLALLEVGSSSAGKVVEKSQLQNAVVHRAFHSLAEKGLITSVLTGKVRQYQAIEPRLLLQFIEDKKVRLRELLPELEARRLNAQAKPQATIFQGVRGVKELIYHMINTSTKEYRSYGGPQKANDLLGEYFWDRFHRDRIKRKIKARLLFNHSLEEWGDQLKKRPLTIVKTTSKEFEAFTETVECGNRVAIIIYAEKPFGFLIESPEVALSYRKFFDLMWR